MMMYLKNSFQNWVEMRHASFDTSGILDPTLMIWLEMADEIL